MTSPSDRQIAKDLDIAADGWASYKRIFDPADDHPTPRSDPQAAEDNRPTSHRKLGRSVFAMVGLRENRRRFMASVSPMTRQPFISGDLAAHVLPWLD